MYNNRTLKINFNTMKLKSYISIVVALFVAFAVFGLDTTPAQAGSCVYPVTQVSWTGKVISGVNVRDKTCMDSSVIGKLSGGAIVAIYGEADGWYQVKLSDGTKGFVWNSWITVTSKQSNTSHEISSEYKTTETYTKETTTVKEPVPTLYEKDAGLTDRVKGYILLQVESFGEAWYVNPDDSKRYYMKDGSTAYEMMRQFGLGVSNADMDKINKGDWTLINRLKGKIVLQVELHGEAFYIHPKDGSVHYLKNGDEAYRIMRDLSLGITNADLNQVASKDFETFVAEKESGQVLGGDGLALAGVVENGKVFLKWSVNGVDAPQGFKVVSSTSPNPVYPGSKYHYLSDPAKRSDTWTGLAGIYHFRVCQYLGGSCGVYSNNLTLDVTPATSTPAGDGKIVLAGVFEGGKVNLKWSADGVDAPKGFKVITSVKSNPVYPGDTYHYLSDPAKRSDVWSGLSSGTHHFRVCQYLGGACGVYSNDVAVTVTGTEIDTSGVLTLTGAVENGKVYLQWDVVGVDVPKGFKVITSSEMNPVYPGNTYHYLDNSSARTDTWADLSAGTHHFRVCQYLGGACGAYSNDLSLVIVETPSSPTTDNGISNSTYQLGVVPVGVDLEELNNYWLNKINALRAESGLRQLVLDQRWVDTSTEWASYMGENDLMTHDRPDGKTMHQWIDTKGLSFTDRYSDGGWTGNYFTENIAWGYINDGTTASTKTVLDDTLAFFLSEESYNGAHYRTIYHVDWNSVGMGLHFEPRGGGQYKVSVAFHYGSLVLQPPKSPVEGSCLQPFCKHKSYLV